MIRRVINYLKSAKTEALMYLIAGGCTTVVNFGAFTLLVSVLGIDHNISNVIAIIVSIIFAYVTNKIFVFRSHCGTRKGLASEAAKFVGGRLFAMVVEVIGVAVLVDGFSLNEYAAKIAMQVVVIIMNYIISKLLVFK